MRPTPRLLSGIIGGAALAYFAVVFGVGVVLGAMQVLLISSLWGELPAVALELPIVLLASWLACGVMFRMFDVRGLGRAAAMGFLPLLRSRKARGM